MKAIAIRLPKREAVHVHNLEDARRLMLDANWPLRGSTAYNKVLSHIAAAQAGHMRIDVAFNAFVEEATERGVLAPEKELYINRK